MPEIPIKALFRPERVYYEPAALEYPLGRLLQQRYAALPWQPIESHNDIPALRSSPNSAFPRLKRNLILGVRKTHRYTPNHKTSDFLVPYTSSGCSAACLYCYLVCNYNKCAYLRLFVNREEMLQRLLDADAASEAPRVFEIGSNSDLVLENTLTGNLCWTIENFARARGQLTLPTKFAAVEPLLPLEHRGRTILRMSVNPPEIIRRIELGTAPLSQRIEAVNGLAAAGYPVGLLIAPVILLPDWRTQYGELLTRLADGLSPAVKRQARLEIILMTYSYIHRRINEEAFPGAPDLFDPVAMAGRGRGKYAYRAGPRAEAEAFFRERLPRLLPGMEIAYIS